MPLMPLDADDTDADDDPDAVTLTGIDVSGGDREQILEALRLNRQLLHDPQPDAEVDETAVRQTIDDLLDQLNAAK
jgi:hypothetical protein